MSPQNNKSSFRVFYKSFFPKTGESPHYSVVTGISPVFCGGCEALYSHFQSLLPTYLFANQGEVESGLVERSFYTPYVVSCALFEGGLPFFRCYPFSKTLRSCFDETTVLPSLYEGEMHGAELPRLKILPFVRCVRRGLYDNLVGAIRVCARRFPKVKRYLSPVFGGVRRGANMGKNAVVGVCKLVHVSPQLTFVPCSRCRRGCVLLEKQFITPKRNCKGVIGLKKQFSFQFKRAAKSPVVCFTAPRPLTGR